MNDLSNDEPCPVCGRFANRGVSVDAVIISDNKILLSKRGVEPFKGYWGTPGGYVSWNESTEDAVRREVLEEMGVTLKNVQLVKVDSNPKRHPKQVINFVYLAEVDGGEVSPGDDSVGAEWFPLDALPSEFAFDHRQNIQDAVNSL